MVMAADQQPHEYFLKFPKHDIEALGQIDKLVVKVAATALLVAAAVGAEGPLVLSPRSLGPLPLGNSAKVSERQLVKLFPQFAMFTSDAGHSQSRGQTSFTLRDHPRRPRALRSRQENHDERPHQGERG